MNNFNKRKFIVSGLWSLLLFGIVSVIIFILTFFIGILSLLVGKIWATIIVFGLFVFIFGGFFFYEENSEDDEERTRGEK